MRRLWRSLVIAVLVGPACEGSDAAGARADATATGGAGGSGMADMASLTDVAGSPFDLPRESASAADGPTPDTVGPDLPAGPRPTPLVWVKESPIFGRAIGGTGPEDVWVVGTNGRAWHSRGDGVWQERSADTPWELNSVWGSGANDVYASVMANLVLHWNGQLWEKQVEGIPIGATYAAVWGSGPRDIYLAGPGLYRSSGDGRWMRQTWPVGAGPFVGIWGSGPNDVWVLGGGGVLRSKGDGIWRLENTGRTIAVTAIWGSGPDDVYALYGGAVAHTRGDGSWTVTEIPDRLPVGEVLSDIWGSGPSDVYITADAGRVFRSLGDGRWFPETVDAKLGAFSIFAVWGSGPGNVYLLTAGGIYRGR
jgi:hypothetical protein